MSNYEEGIALIEFNKQKYAYLNDLSRDIPHKEKTQKDKWNYECLILYKKFLETLNRSTIVNKKEEIIQMFNESIFRMEDKSANFRNFSGENYFGQYKESIENSICEDLAVKKQYEILIRKINDKSREVMYTDEEFEVDANSLRNLIQKQYEKFCKNDGDSRCVLKKILERFYNMFFDTNYYKSVDKFFKEMYSFCQNGRDKDYQVPYFDDYDFLREDRWTIVERINDNKEFFLEVLYSFLMLPVTLLLNDIEELKFPVRNDAENKNVSESLSFFCEKNNSDFFSDSKNFLDVNNQFYLGKISICKIEDKDKDLRRAVKSVLEYYHMQKDCRSIDSLSDFHTRIKRSDLTKALESNMTTIKEELEKKYSDTEYSDIPDLFVELLKKQKIFFKIDNSKDTGNLDDEYFNLYGYNISKEEKYEILGGKYNLKGLNEELENFEIIVYNAAVRVSDPHFPEKQREDYYKQLTVFFPEVYSLLY